VSGEGSIIIWKYLADFQIWILGQLTFHSTCIRRLRHGTI